MKTGIKNEDQALPVRVRGVGASEERERRTGPHVKQIALVVRHFSESGGGLERYTVGLARTLLAAGWAVTVVCRSSDMPPLPHLTVRRVAASRTPRFLAPIFFHRAAQVEIARQTFDVVVALSPTYPADLYRMGDGVIADWVSRQAQTKIGRWLRCVFRPVRFSNLYLEQQILSGGSRRLIANSHLCRRQAESIYGVPPDRIEGIHNGVDLATFHPGVKTARSEIRKEHGISDDAPLLLFAAMNFKRKGLSELIQSLPRLRSDFPGLHLIVAGKERAAPYQGQARTLGVAETITFVGPVKMAPYYGAADLFVLPTHSDPFANVCLEAMACGLPVVTTRENGAAELIEEGENGATVPHASDIDALAGAIRSMLRDPRGAGVRAAETARGYSLISQGKKFVDACQRMADDRLPLETMGGTSLMTVHRDFIPVLKQSGLLSFDAVMATTMGQVIKSIPARTINRLTLPPHNDLFYLKRHRSPSAWARIWKRRPSEGQGEWKQIVAFHAAGLPTMTPVAAGERRTFFSDESFLMTRSLDGYVSLEKWVPSVLASQSPLQQARMKRRLIDPLATLTHKMHQAGFYHRDFYLTHLLIKEGWNGEEEIDLRIIDLQRVIRPIWFVGHWRIKDIAALHYSTPAQLFTRRERLRFYLTYLGCSERPNRRFLRAVEQKAKRIDAHSMKIYARRDARRRLGLDPTQP
jgi:UDP-glucose:(heptosyl)LPS alpha-1,3-glucosyltransferase